ncbi:hypothetical protein RB594_005893 [Gaeumannomyces avenae]
MTGPAATARHTSLHAGAGNVVGLGAPHTSLRLATYRICRFPNVRFPLATPSQNERTLTLKLGPFVTIPPGRSDPQTSTMFGPFRITNPLNGGLLWKIPWRLSRFQKLRHRRRLRAVDSIVDTISQALSKKGETLKALDRWKAEMPREEEMLPKDKYTIFDRKEKKYRKGIHKLPKWTRVSQRVNPPGF